MVESNFAFIDPVSTVYYGGPAGYAPINMINNNVKPAVI